MASINIREFKFPDDYSRVIRLWEQIEKGIHVGPSDALGEIEKKIKRDPELFLIAEADGEFIGTVIGGFDGRRGFVYHLAVSNLYRNQGIGSRLLREVEGRLRTKGCLRCFLFVTSDNVEAMRFYENHGWAPMDKDEPYAKDLV
jgi:ribosomal protein S18 acetylase RimI-like enzyme